jgi:hypothetical protein
LPAIRNKKQGIRINPKIALEGGDKEFYQEIRNGGNLAGGSGLNTEGTTKHTKSTK